MLCATLPMFIRDYRVNLKALDVVETLYFGCQTTDPRNDGLNRALTHCENAVRESVEHIRDLGGLLLIASK